MTVSRNILGSFTRVRNRFRRWVSRINRSCPLDVIRGRPPLGRSLVVPVCRKRWFKPDMVALASFWQQWVESSPVYASVKPCYVDFESSIPSILEFFETDFCFLDDWAIDIRGQISSFAFVQEGHENV